MNIVIDSNILFSALIKQSMTRRLILDYSGFFLFPSLIFEEMEQHKYELIEKSGMQPEDFNHMLGLLLQKVIVVPTEVLSLVRNDAWNIAKDIDPDDVLFIACILAYPQSVLWSDDKALKKANRIVVLNTKEMMKLFHLLGRNDTLIR